MDAKAASGVSFDEVQKKIIYVEIEVVKMKSYVILNILLHSDLILIHSNVNCMTNL